jgi:hypothetical protein
MSLAKASASSKCAVTREDDVGIGRGEVTTRRRIARLEDDGCPCVLRGNVASSEMSNCDVES